MDAKNNPNFKHNAPTEEFKRPNHNDFRTTKELKDIKFSGTRANSITDTVEFWVLGEIVDTVPGVIARGDPAALRKKHIEVFAMGNDPDGRLN
ncbi:MAG: hypothetical protein AB7F19_07645 [Candidatus Babeliales bacterium]